MIALASAAVAALTPVALMALIGVSVGFEEGGPNAGSMGYERGR